MIPTLWICQIQLWILLATPKLLPRLQRGFKGLVHQLKHYVTSIEHWLELKGTTPGSQREIGDERDGDGIVRANYLPLQWSESLTYQFCLFILPNSSFFFLASFSYSGSSDMGSILTLSTPQDQQALVTDTDKSEFESKWHDHEPREASVPWQASRFLEGIAIKVCSHLQCLTIGFWFEAIFVRPSWLPEASPTTPGPVDINAMYVNTSQESSMSGINSAIGTSLALAMPVWPADMNIVFLKGTLIIVAMQFSVCDVSPGISLTACTGRMPPARSHSAHSRVSCYFQLPFIVIHHYVVIFEFLCTCCREGIKFNSELHAGSALSCCIAGSLSYIAVLASLGYVAGPITFHCITVPAWFSCVAGPATFVASFNLVFLHAPQASSQDSLVAPQACQAHSNRPQSPASSVMSHDQNHLVTSQQRHAQAPLVMSQVSGS